MYSIPIGISISFLTQNHFSFFLALHIVECGNKIQKRIWLPKRLLESNNSSIRNEIPNLQELLPLTTMHLGPYQVEKALNLDITLLRSANQSIKAQKNLVPKAERFSPKRGQ